MNYQTSALAKLAGVSQRTIRYYENEGLLIAKRDPQNQYRYFDESQVDRLQQILFYRQLDLPLAQIKKIMLASNYEIVATLQQQQRALKEQRAHLDRLLASIDATIRHQKGELDMTDLEKFQAFKEEQLNQNETKFGAEIREKYGEATVKKANENWLGRNQSDFQKLQALEADLFKQLQLVAENHDLYSEAAQQAFQDHRSWLELAWGDAHAYSPEAHRGIADMYVADPRFTKYYDDRGGLGTATLLRDIINLYAK
ncbi:MerR family transcriptional regulator [Lapidilactobacillus mulanensis]|uniref:MerR family transcriptional regulator n=1 Tax=Lapidilactobacillus mulanensis TaxID=2485999 RepID=A0ABW4DJE5_9LACO|nr:MerR family transcriptional regulator [Lapidilactobacillus mulanensis]